MPDGSRISVAQLPRGFQFPARSFHLSDTDVERYRAAVETEGRGMPAMAVAAFALRRLLESMDLPAGSLHASQDVEFLALAQPGQDLGLRAEIVQRSERAGFVAAVIEFVVTDPAGPVLKGRSTVLAPAEA